LLYLLEAAELICFLLAYRNHTEEGQISVQSAEWVQ